jgi:two-component system sensor histidine kinase HydH
MQKIETIKGILFIVITSGFLFWFSYFLFKRIYRKEQDVRHHHHALMLAEQRAIAGIFASSIAHDINNILMTYQISVELLKESSGLSPEEQKLTDHLYDSFDRLKDLSQRLMAMGKEQIPGNLSECNLSILVTEITNQLKKHRKVRRCSFEVMCDDGILLKANQATINQLLINLIMNAADAVDSNGTIRVILRATDTAVVIEVEDNGPGIPEHTRKQVFTPFFTTKADGTGLGLLSVSACVEEHKGIIELTRSNLGGARFIISLPRESVSKASHKKD